MTPVFAMPLHRSTLAGEALPVATGVTRDVAGRVFGFAPHLIQLGLESTA
jgi:hypothetical protein